MEPETSQTQSLQEQPVTAVTPPKKQGFLKKKKLLALVVFLIILSMGAVVLWTIQRSSSPEIGSNPSEIDYVVDNANTVSGYISEQRNNDGSYKYQGYEEDTCPIVDGILKCSFLPDNTSFPVKTWAAFGYWSSYKTSQDTARLALARQEVLELIQWCRLTNENCAYLLAQMTYINRDLQDETINEFLKEQANILIENPPSVDLMLRAIEARQLGLIGEALSDINLINSSIQRLSLVNELLQAQSYDYTTGRQVLPRGACWATLAQVELSRITNDSSGIVNGAEYLLQSNRLTDVREFENPVQLQPCIETFFLAYKSTGYINYQNLGIELYNLLYEDFFDGPDNPIKYGNGGTTFISRARIENGEDINIFLADTAYTNYLSYLRYENR